MTAESASSMVLSPLFKVVVVVASLGGLHAVSEVLRALPHSFRVPVIVIQHHQAQSEVDRLASVLQNHSRLPVVTATDGMVVGRQTVVVIPAGFNATLNSRYRLTLTAGADRHRGDMTLCSVAGVFGPSAIAVVLSGLLDDGTSGVRAIKRSGGRVLVQDPRAARAPAMPASAIATGCVDYVLETRHIASALVALTMAPGGADLLTVPAPHWATRDT